MNTNRFGRLTLIEQLSERKNGKIMLRLRCDCGAVVDRRKDHVVAGKTTSCSCAVSDFSVGRFTTHGHASGGVLSREYVAWRSMRARCENPNNKRFKDYGGRGIQVCERWRKFENFLADMGAKPPGLTLDRVDVNGHYEPGNCRWATWLEQRRNRRDAVTAIPQKPTA